MEWRQTLEESYQSRQRQWLAIRAVRPDACHAYRSADSMPGL